MDAPTLSALASHSLYHHQGQGQAGRATDQSYVWFGLMDGPPPDHLQAELLHPSQKEAPGAEGGQETQHNQTEMPAKSPTEPRQQTQGPLARSRQRRREVGVLQGCSSLCLQTDQPCLQTRSRFLRDRPITSTVC